jgi:hypothetical protein
MEFRDFIGFFFRRKRVENKQALPEALVPLSRLYAADDTAVTSAKARLEKQRGQRAVVSVS